MNSFDCISEEVSEINSDSLLLDQVRRGVWLTERSSNYIHFSDSLRRVIGNISVWNPAITWGCALELLSWFKSWSTLWWYNCKVSITSVTSPTLLHLTNTNIQLSHIWTSKCRKRSITCLVNPNYPWSRLIISSIVVKFL